MAIFAIALMGAATIAQDTPYSDYAKNVLNVSHYYNLNEAANSAAVADSGNATAINGTTSFGTGGNLGVSGPILPGLGGASNTAFNVNGNSFIQLATTMPSDVFSLAVWIRINAGSGFQRIFVNSNIPAGPSADNYFSLVYNYTTGGAGNGPGLQIVANRSSGGRVLQKSVVPLDDGLWHHVVVAGGSSGAITSLVVDGIDRLAATAASTELLSNAATANAYIGARDNTTGYFSGGIDELAIWLGTGLTAAQGIALYNASLVPEPASAILMLFGLSALGIFRRRARIVGVRRQ